MGGAIGALQAPRWSMAKRTGRRCDRHVVYDLVIRADARSEGRIVSSRSGRHSTRRRWPRRRRSPPCCSAMPIVRSSGTGNFSANFVEARSLDGIAAVIAMMRVVARGLGRSAPWHRRQCSLERRGLALWPARPGRHVELDHTPYGTCRRPLRPARNRGLSVSRLWISTGPFSVLDRTFFRTGRR